MYDKCISSWINLTFSFQLLSLFCTFSVIVLIPIWAGSTVSVQSHLNKSFIIIDSNCYWPIVWPLDRLWIIEAYYNPIFRSLSRLKYAMELMQCRENNGHTFLKTCYLCNHTLPAGGRQVVWSSSHHPPPSLPTEKECLFGDLFTLKTLLLSPVGLVLVMMWCRVRGQWRLFHACTFILLFHTLQLPGRFASSLVRSQTLTPIFHAIDARLLFYLEIIKA